MVEPEIPGFSGLDAVRRLAEEAGSWPEAAEDWQWCARFGYQVIERRGTGGGAFRLMYSRFLEEAGRPEAPLAADAAARWTELAEAFHAASESDDPEPGLWREVDATAGRGRGGRGPPLDLARQPERGMAEGDTILRAARRIEAALASEPLAVSAPNPRGRAAGVERLDGLTFEGVETRGKNLLLDFGELSLHSHMGMNGSWHVYPVGARWRKPRRSAWAVLRGERARSGPVRRLDPAGAADRGAAARARPPRPRHPRAGPRPRRS